MALQKEMPVRMPDHHTVKLRLRIILPVEQPLVGAMTQEHNWGCGRTVMKHSSLSCLVKS